MICADKSLGASNGLRSRIDVATAARDGEADHRGGEPGLRRVVRGKPLEHLFRRIQLGDGRLDLASRQLEGGGDQVRLRFGPGLAERHACELIGGGRITRRLEDLGNRELVDDHAGGERPVAGMRGVPYSVGESAVPQIPASGLSMQ